MRRICAFNPREHYSWNKTTHHIRIWHDHSRHTSLPAVCRWDISWYTFQSITHYSSPHLWSSPISLPPGNKLAHAVPSRTWNNTPGHMDTKYNSVRPLMVFRKSIHIFNTDSNWWTCWGWRNLHIFFFCTGPWVMVRLIRRIGGE